MRNRSRTVQVYRPQVQETSALDVLAQSSISISYEGLLNGTTTLSIQKIISVENLLDKISENQRVTGKDIYLIVPPLRNTYLKIKKPHPVRQLEFCNGDKIVSRTFKTLLESQKKNTEGSTGQANVKSLNDLLGAFYKKTYNMNFEDFSTLTCFDKIQSSKNIDDLNIDHESIFLMVILQKQQELKMLEQIQIRQPNLCAVAIHIDTNTSNMDKKDTPFGKKKNSYVPQNNVEIQSRKNLKLIHKNIQKQQTMNIQKNKFIPSLSRIQNQHEENKSFQSNITMSEIQGERIIIPPKINNADFDLELTESNYDSDEDQQFDSNWLKGSMDLGKANGPNKIPHLNNIADFDMDEEFEEF